MIHNLRRAFVALPLSLLLAGCSGNELAEFRPTSTVVLTASTTDQDATRDSDHRISRRDARPVTHPDVLLANGTTSEARYHITLNEIRELVRNGKAVIIDARGPADFALGHVRGALNMPADQKEAYMAQISQRVTPEQLIIIYCNGPHCDWSDTVCAYFISQGYNNVRVFKPGWHEIALAGDLQ